MKREKIKKEIGRKGVEITEGIGKKKRTK